MTKIMAINAGSSSLKFQLFNMPKEEIITKGVIERIGFKDAFFKIMVKGREVQEVKPILSHEEAVKLLLKKLTQLNIIHSLNEIDGVGHRVVHGGEMFEDSAIVDENVLQRIEELAELAPLHNRANAIGIRAFQSVLPNVTQVAVFDTAFHQSMPPSSYLYSLPYEYYEKYRIRKYGFHGTSHKYVSRRAAQLLRRPIKDLRLISCHLGNGASITAIQGGKSVDTSMGFTPLAGVTMGTRSGDIDPALIPFIMEKTGKTAEEVIDILNKESGLLGLSGVSSDLRDIQESVEQQHNHRAELALEVFASKIHEYIGSYAAKMAGVDAIIFTAGIGTNSDFIRAKILTGLEFMGVYWDPNLNRINGKEAFINYPHSPVKVLIIPTNEEVMIARDVVRLEKDFLNESYEANEVIESSSY
ncbi:acetate kinase [Heyndrickxia ginsengihumi]|uniref:Acetate kinase n=1 Tax=Heyndrickxia ginsengihumi TaxID=363870 RepID=A0A6M0PAS3_9BACI|nr:acetate kinase [Heyndrickxia ginsengihumi]MBE6182661.1 acetate kinase [Bacillus sp. (in: firmicutes)]MCM3022026.1 acetate kinase [Heyndrickxia ginsengihumi]NEY21089.1 acetate kinase [Heyndrickxia ginsengihumi]